MPASGRGIPTVLSKFVSNGLTSLSAVPLNILIVFADPAAVAQLHQWLNSEVIAFMQQAYALRTHSAYRTHRRAYLSFCVVMGLVPVPAQVATVCLYATVLTRSLKYSSIKQHLNIVRILHLEWIPNPMTNCYQYKCVMCGIRCQFGDQPNRKLPMTTDLLIKIFLDMSLLPDCTLNVVVRATKQFSSTSAVSWYPSPAPLTVPSVRHRRWCYICNAQAPLATSRCQPTPLFVISLDGEPLTSSDFNRRV